MSKRTKRHNIFFHLLFSTLIMCQCGCKEKKTVESSEVQTCPVKILTVSANSEPLFREYPGKVKASRRVKLAFEVTGRIINFPIKCGDRVKQGQVLGKLDSRDFENTLKSSTATYEESRSEFMRYSRLIEKAVVSAAAFELKKKAYDVADAAMKTAAKALDDTTIQAPFDGIIAGTYVDNYQNILAREPVLSLQDISQVEIIANIPEKDIIRSDVDPSIEQINRNFILTAQFPALGEKEFPVMVKEFETEADPGMQTFKAVATMKVPGGINIMPGMTALLKVRRNKANNNATGVWIPAAAVIENNNGKRYVWLVGADMRVLRRNVEIGELKRDSIFVIKGLAAGERLTTTGVTMLTDGMHVTELTAIDGHKLSNHRVNTP